MSAGQVDGYGPGEFDSLHWDLLVGGVSTVFMGGALVYFSRQVSGPVATWFAAIGAVLILLAIAGCGVSSFYRRYLFLIWWRDAIILLSGAPFLLPNAFFWLTLAIPLRINPNAYRFYGRDTVRSVAMSEILESREKEEEVLDVAVDEHGRVYDWNGWHGRWYLFADSMDELPHGTIRVRKTLSVPLDMPADEPDPYKSES